MCQLEESNWLLGKTERHTLNAQPTERTHGEKKDEIGARHPCRHDMRVDDSSAFWVNQKIATNIKKCMQSLSSMKGQRRPDKAKAPSPLQSLFSRSNLRQIPRKTQGQHLAIWWRLQSQSNSETALPSTNAIWIKSAWYMWKPGLECDWGQYHTAQRSKASMRPIQKPPGYRLDCGLPQRVRHYHTSFSCKWKPY